MMASWMLYTLMVGALVVAAAALAERVLRWLALPLRGVWAAAIVLALVLPFATALRTIQPIRADGVYTSTDMTLTLTLPAPVSAGLTTLPALPPLPGLDLPLLALWAGASLLLLAALLHGVGVLQGRRREWRRANVDGREILVAADLGPAVIGWRRMQIVLPAWALTLDAEGRRLILAHEDEHIQRRDPALLLGGLVAALLVPWNAPLWYLYRRLRLAIELDCDTRVVAGGADRARYGEVLLVAGAQGRSGGLPALATFAERATQLESRITALTPAPVRGRGSKAMLVGITAAAALVAACAIENPLGLDLTDTEQPVKLRMDGTLMDAPTMGAIRTMVRRMVEQRFPGALERGGVPEETIVMVVLNAEQQVLTASVHLTRDRNGPPPVLADVAADQIEAIEVLKGRAVGIENVGVIVATVKPGAMLRRRRVDAPEAEGEWKLVSPRTVGEVPAPGDGEVPVGPEFMKRAMPGEESLAPYRELALPRRQPRAPIPEGAFREGVPTRERISDDSARTLLRLRGEAEVLMRRPGG